MSVSLKNSQETSRSITVYYDGLCLLCSKEINHYKKQEGATHIEFVDITDKEFKASEHGVDPYLVHKIMHVKKRDGSFATAVDAFIEIWKVLPKYNWLVPIAKSGLIKPFMLLGYHVFARLRPYLPRRKEACKDSPYCEVKK